MAKKVKVSAVAAYNGHSIKTNKNVEISFKFNYDELQRYVQLIQFLNEDVSICIKIGNSPALNIGMFRIKDMKIDNDGEGVVKFNSMVDFVNAGNINELVGSELLKVLFTSEIDIEENNESENEENDV